MTPQQMLEKLSSAKEAPRSPTIWVPPERVIRNRDPIVEEATATYNAETMALIQGICPRCALKVELLADQSGSRMRYQCVSQNPYHYFVRQL